jgi:iron-sulfur cluster insertion protein
MITLTDAAAQKLKYIIEEDKVVEEYLRVKIIGAGCSGFQYDLFFDSSLGQMDELFEEKGIKIIVDPISYQYIDGTIVDYMETLAQSGFKFINPNVKSTCGCGSSVSF